MKSIARWFLRLAVLYLLVGVAFGIFMAIRGGLTNLNSALSGNSGHDAGLERVWRKGVFDGQEEIAGCKEAAAQA